MRNPPPRCHYPACAETWHGMQIDCDLARVRNKGDIMVRRVARVG